MLLYFLFVSLQTVLWNVIRASQAASKCELFILKTSFVWPMDAVEGMHKIPSLSIRYGCSQSFFCLFFFSFRNCLLFLAFRGTSYVNRPGQKKLDFCLNSADHGMIRLNCASSKISSAIVTFAGFLSDPPGLSLYFPVRAIPALFPYFRRQPARTALILQKADMWLTG
jgi:hypothetical protein